MSEQFENNYITQLNGAIDNDDTTIVVDAGPTSLTGNFRIIIENELIFVGSVSGTTFSNCIRGIEGTSAVSHSDNTPVIHIITTQSIENLARFGPHEIYNPDRPPLSPGSLNDEFDDGSVSGNWSAWTGATDPATTDETTYPGHLYIVASASVSAPTYMQKAFTPSSGEAFAFAIKIRMAGEVWENHSFQFGLAVMSASTTVIHETRAVASDGTNGQSFMRLYDSISTQTRSINSLAFTGAVYLMVGRNTSNEYAAYWSKDGYIWARLNPSLGASATAVSHISLSIPANTTGGNRRVLVDFFRQFSSAPSPDFKIGA